MVRKRRRFHIDTHNCKRHMCHCTHCNTSAISFTHLAYLLKNVKIPVLYISSMNQVGNLINNFQSYTIFVFPGKISSTIVEFFLFWTFCNIYIDSNIGYGFQIDVFRHRYILSRLFSVTKKQ